MNSEKIINLMFDEIENDGGFPIPKSREYFTCSKYQQLRGEELYNYIDNNIPKKVRDELKKKIENYTDSCHATYDSESKIYFRYGFIYGIGMVID